MSKEYGDKALEHRIARLEKELSKQKRFENINRCLYAISNAIGTTTHLDALYASIHRSLSLIIDTTNFFIATYEASQDKITFPYCVDEVDGRLPPVTGVSKTASLTAEVIRTKQPLLVNKNEIIEKRKNCGLKVPDCSPSEIWLGVPLKVRDDIIGVMAVQSYTDPNRYDDTDLEVMRSVADQVALAIERKKTEEALAESEERFRRLAENSPDMIYRMSLPDGKYEYVSPSALEITGYPPESWYKNQYIIRDIIHPDWHEYFEEQWARLLEGKTPPTYEYQIVHKNGEVRWVNQRNVMVKDSEGRPIAIEGIATDISKRKQAEDALRESEEKYRVLFNQSLLGIYLHDLEGRILDLNQEACQQSGYEKDELLTLSVFDLHPKSGATLNLPRDEILRLWNQWRPGQRNTYEAEHQCKDGTVFPVEVSTGVLEYGNEQYIMAICQDITERKRAEEKQRELETQLSEAMEIALLGHWEYNVEKDIFTFNDQFYKVFRTTADQAGGYAMSSMQYAQRFIHPDDRGIVENEIRKCIEASDPNFSHQLEHRILYADGEMGYITVRCLIVKDDSGKTIRTYGVNQDITDRKRAEEALKKKDAMLVNMASQVPGMLYQFMMGPDGAYSTPYSSNGIMDIFGCSPEDVRDDFNPIFNAIHPEDRNKILQTIQESIKSLSQWRCEYRVQVPGRPIKWVYGNSMPEKKADGSIVWSGYNMDITERKQAETALRESEEQFRHFFEHLTIGVAVYDAVSDGEDFVFSDINLAAQKLCNVSLDEILDRRITQVFPGVRDLGLFRALQNVWRTGTPEYVPLRLYEDERIHQWVENRIFKLPSKKMVAVFDDRTEIKRLEEGLRQAQKMEAIGTLAGGIAHDFNNMLSVFTGNISYALSILNEEDELFEVLTDALQGTKQAQALTHQLLTFAKGGEPIKKACDINKLLVESAKFVTSGAKSKCDFKLTDDLWTVEVDSGQINQVISNIVINADQAMPNGGVIAIQSENAKIATSNDFQLSAGRYIKICIEDQGIGIQGKHLSNIFDPYFTTKQKGSGLGLASAYSIVNRHGGHINVSSEVGKGTVFNIYLPASSKEIIKAADKKQSKHHGHGRILIMDDQELILTMAGKMFNLMGYETEIATDGAKAIEAYREAFDTGKPFDLVILDLTVPGGMGGAKAIPELLKIDPKVKAVVSSGYSNDPIMANYQDYGFSGVLPKPYTKGDLSDLLNRIFGDKQPKKDAAYRQRP